MSHTNVVFLRNSNRHPVGVLAIHSTPDDPEVRVAASICAYVDKFDKEVGIEIACRRLFEPEGRQGPRQVRSTTQEFEDAVALASEDAFVVVRNIGLNKLMGIAMLAVLRSGAPFKKLERLDICIDPMAVAACERYARKGRGRAKRE